MITFFATMLAALTLLIGFIFGFYQSFIEEELSTNTQLEESTKSTIPLGTPGQSAPAAAVETCATKKIDDLCAFKLAEKNLEGVCSLSGDELACTPILPK
jgi:hypothetical protein